VISVWYLLSPSLFRVAGVRVISIDDNAECGNLKIGDLITQIEGTRIENREKFDTVLGSVSADEHITIIVNGGSGGCTALGAGDIGVQVSNVDSGYLGLEFGIDLVGGENVLLSSSDELSYDDVSYISGMLEKRLTVTELKDAKISVDDKTIIISTASNSRLGPLLTNGKIEAVIQQEVKLANNSGRIIVDTDSYDIYWDGSNVIVDGSSYNIGDFFSLDDIQFRVVNVTNVSIIVDALIFENNDIAKIPTATGYVKYDSSANQYQFNVPVEVLEAAGTRFSKITKSLVPLYGVGGNVLNGVLVYYLDSEEITRLSIPSDMSDTPIKTISILGGEPTMGEAVNKKMLFEIALEGEIEKDMSVENIEYFSGGFGWVLWSGMIVVTGVIIVMFVLAVIRYKNIKVAVFCSGVLLLEIVYMFGVASISQSALTSGWVIDATSLFGICTFAIISMAQIILLSDKALRQRILKRYNQFVFSVFIVGFLLLFTPLNRFGLVLIVGGLIGALLTKPVYVDFLSEFR